MTDSQESGARGARRSDEDILAAVPKPAGAHEARVGIFVILGVISFILVLFLLTDPATLRGRYLLVTTVEDAGGVRRGDPVQMRGVNIGRIHAFEMLPDERVAITMEIEGEWKIPEGSVTRLGASGLFGGRTLEIVPAMGEEVYEPMDTIPSTEAGGGLLGTAEELSEKASSVMERLESLLNPGTVQSVEGTAAGLDTLLAELSDLVAEQRGTVRSLTESLARSAKDLEGAGPDAASAIARADSAMAVLVTTGVNLDRAASALRSILDRMERGEGTLGRLSTDAALYDNLNKAAESLAALMDDIRANPSRYVNISIF